MKKKKSPAAKAAKKTVLVVDDDPEIAHLISEILNEDYRVLVVNDGLQAIEETSRHHVNLILMDIRMPYFSGLWFCDAFKRKKNTKNIPIVIVSGLLDEDNTQRARLAGAADTVKKPFTTEQLLRAVEKNAL